MSPSGVTLNLFSHSTAGDRRLGRVGMEKWQDRGPVFINHSKLKYCLLPYCIFNSMKIIRIFKNAMAAPKMKWGLDLSRYWQISFQKIISTHPVPLVMPFCDTWQPPEAFAFYFLPNFQ
jgi:hypothetical protein